MDFQSTLYLVVKAEVVKRITQKKWIIYKTQLKTVRKFLITREFYSNIFGRFTNHHVVEKAESALGIMVYTNSTLGNLAKIRGLRPREKKIFPLLGRVRWISGWEKKTITATAQNWGSKNNTSLWEGTDISPKNYLSKSIFIS